MSEEQAGNASDEAEGSLVERVRDFAGEGLWRYEAPPRSAAWLGLGIAQLVAMIANGFVRHRLLLRASALTYVAMLSLVPMVAVALGVAEAFGVGVTDRLAPLIVSQLAAGAPEAAEKIVQLVQSVNFTSLGSVGAASLLFTTVLAVGNAEQAFNEVWGVEQQRPLMRRFPDYLAVIVVAPVLLGVAVVLATGLQSESVVQRFGAVPGFETVYRFGLRQAPTLLMWAGFSFLYWFMPNTQVKAGAALLGGAVAAVLFALAQALYVGFSVGVSRANAVFGGLAALPLLLTWIYISAAITLLGAEVSYAQQNLRLYRREMRSRDAGPADRQAIGLAAAVLIGHRFRDGEAPWNADDLAEVLGAPLRTVRQVVGALVEARVLAYRGSERDGALQLARPAERIPAHRVLDVLHGSRGEIMGPSHVGTVVEDFLQELERGEEEAAGQRTLADLIQRLERATREAGRSARPSPAAAPA